MRRAAENMISVSIGRFGTDPQTVEIEKDATVGDALDAAGIDLNSNEKVWVNGERAQNRDILEDGDTVNIVTPKEAGNQ